MAEDAPANATLAGPGLQSLLKRAAEDERFRAQLLDGLAASERARLQPPAAQPPSVGAPMPAGIMPDMPPRPVAQGISPDMPPKPARVGSQDIGDDMKNVVLTGISPDMPPQWKQAQWKQAEWKRKQIGRRRGLVALALLLAAIGAALWWWLAG